MDLNDFNEMLAADGHSHRATAILNMSADRDGVYVEFADDSGAEFLAVIEDGEIAEIVPAEEIA